MELIDLEGERAKAKAARRKNGHSERFVIGPDGRKYYEFDVSYGFKEKRWTFTIYALSKAEAIRRVDAIKRLPVDVEQVVDIVIL